MNHAGTVDDSAYISPFSGINYTRPCNNCLLERFRIPSWLFPVSHGIFFRIQIPLPDPVPEMVGIRFGNGSSPVPVNASLCSMCGLLAKSLVVDNVIESINLCKYFTIISSDPEPICDFIQNVLNRSTTLYNAEGGYSHENKKVILCALDRRQAVILQRFIRQTDDSAFIMITKSSETFGKGFRLTA